MTAEKGADAGLDLDDEDSTTIQDVFNSLGLNNDMTLKYGPSETIVLQNSIFQNRKTGFTVSEDRYLI